MMPRALPCPNCGCGPVCEIVIDPATTNGTANYTAVSGSFAHFSNHYRSTSANGIFIHNTAGTTGHGRATVRVQQSADGGISRLFGSYVDSSNYLFAELIHDTGGFPEFKLWKRVGGTNTQIGLTYFPTAATTGTYYQLELCWDGETATATFATSSTTTDVIISGAYTGTGNKAGFGGHPNGSTGLYDDFEFYKHYVDDNTCPQCGSHIDCLSCDEGTVPFAVAVTFTGWANASCGSCSSYNATFILPINSPGSQPCSYLAPVGSADFPDPCSYGRLEFLINNAGPEFEIKLGTTFHSWQDSFTAPIDCEATLNSLGIDDSYVELGTPPCDASGVTVVVDAVL